MLCGSIFQDSRNIVQNETALITHIAFRDWNNSETVSLIASCWTYFKKFTYKTFPCLAPSCLQDHLLLHIHRVLSDSEWGACWTCLTLPINFAFSVIHTMLLNSVWIKPCYIVKGTKTIFINTALSTIYSLNIKHWLLYFSVFKISCF